MERYALLLRGINVGRGNSLPMADLRLAMEASGFRDVRTYIQSGNLVFDAECSPAEAEAAIEALRRKYRVNAGRPVFTPL